MSAAIFAASRGMKILKPLLAANPMPIHMEMNRDIFIVSFISESYFLIAEMIFFIPATIITTINPAIKPMPGSLMIDGTSGNA